MRKIIQTFILIALSAAVLSSCDSTRQGAELTPDPALPNYSLTSTTEILLTSEAGQKMAVQKNLGFKKGSPTGTVINIQPDLTKQTIRGIGTSFTESSAYMLAQLDKDKRAEVMESLYGESGANFSLARTPIGATDFAVKGKYSYASVADDAELKHFSILVDQDGFSPQEYPLIKDPSFDLLPMIQQAIAIKSGQAEKDLRIIASAWTAPSWMKDIEDWYILPTAENNHQGTGGELKPEYVSSYADYIVKYLDAYKAEGVDIWGLTPVNEPHGNSGQWESMHFSPESQNEFIKHHLGPKLQASEHRDTKILIYDQNRDGLEHWADVIFSDPETAPFVYGAAVHWYESTTMVYEEVFERVHEKFPEFSIIHTEGTIDDLGKPAPDGILDPERFKESDWFNNDEFWWNENATDWAYTATWAPNPEHHPVYTPVHRYARNIIVSLNHWTEGWIDWNAVLDQNGGPNHVGNFCGAPIMIDVENDVIYYTPIYYVLAQFSKTIRPGDVAVQTDKHLAGLDEDALHASATLNSDRLLSVQLLNTSKQAIEYQLQIGEQYSSISIAANSLQTVRVQL
ncbi:MAG: glycoside hydrolase family 30 beta sandwich domain-containing protein [Pseudomonadales bacterium]